MYLVKIEELSYKQTAEILEETPQNIKNLIHRGKKELRKYLIKNKLFEMNKISKVLLIIVCTGILLSGVVFAKGIKKFIYELKANIFGTSNQGISTALENNYDVKIDMEYVESGGVGLKIDQILLDDYNLGIICNVDLKELEHSNYLENLYQP